MKTRRAQRRRADSNHPLQRFLTNKKMSQVEFSNLSGVGTTAITRVLTGDRARFSVANALLVVQATKGAVTLEECLGVATARRASSR